MHRDDRFFQEPTGKEELLARIENSDLTELMFMCGHMLHDRQGGDRMRGQNRILMLLARCGALPQQELQQMLDIRPATMSELADKLENKGFLTRTRAAERRGNTLELTDAGKAAAEDAGQPDGGSLFRSLTEEQQDTLCTLMKTLLTDWVNTRPDFAPDRRRRPFPKDDMPFAGNAERMPEHAPGRRGMRRPPMDPNDDMPFDRDDRRPPMPPNGGMPFGRDDRRPPMKHDDDMPFGRDDRRPPTKHDDDMPFGRGDHRPPMKPGRGKTFDHGDRKPPMPHDDMPFGHVDRRPPKHHGDPFAPVQNPPFDAPDDIDDDE